MATSSEREAEAKAKSCDASGGPCHLAELSIRDFAIIETLRIEWAPGFNVLTGETGAGKSIIIDALGAALGDRAEPYWLRSGAERASIEAVIPVSLPIEDLSALLDEIGCSLEDDALIVTRDLLPGRSVSRINGRAVPQAAAQQLADRLVDVHSQASHLSLLRVREHVNFLDRYGQLRDLRDQMSHEARALRDVRREILEREEGQRSAQREAALLRQEVAEIDAAGLEEDEESQLAARRSRLKNAFRLKQLALEAHEALQGGDVAQGALDLLGSAQLRLEEVAGLDPGFIVDSDRLTELVDAADDLARSLRSYADAIEDDPAALESVEERLLAVADLKRKYGATVADVLAYRDAAVQRLEAVEHHEEQMAQLASSEAERLRSAARTAGALSSRRKEVALALEQAAEQELAELGMAGARFASAFSCRADPAGLVLEPGATPVAFDDTGVDQIEFQMSANPGEPPRPLSHVASGGELARVMLALKSVLARVDETPILIFDELDQGVGGRMGHVIGEKLAQLARTHQVLCITHLAQVASYADAHYAVRKLVADGRTTIAVERLGTEDRIEELAVMLAGAQAGPAARRSAEELLARAADWREKVSF
ncbi:MAG TPA: DNA repair protein RecN [Gemmatimonadales bacterium]|nr:DNA repair protein RecN [Gemmatimonadales bacterium]